MDRNDLLTDTAKPTIQAINNLIKTLYSKNLYMTSWYGTLPKKRQTKFKSTGLKNILERIVKKSGNGEEIGMNNRGTAYKPLPTSADDGRFLGIYTRRYSGF
jgi:hypothetical protein